MVRIAVPLAAALVLFCAAGGLAGTISTQVKVSLKVVRHASRLCVIGTRMSATSGSLGRPELALNSVLSGCDDLDVPPTLTLSRGAVDKEIDVATINF